MAPNPFIKGRNVTLTVLLAGENAKANNIIVQAKSFTVKPNGVDIADDILGQDRSDIDYEINFFDVSMSLLIRDLKLLRAALKMQAQRDLQVAMAESAIAVVIKPNDGTREVFQLRQFVLGGWELGFGGRTDRAEMPFPGRARYFEPLPAGA